MLSLPPKLDTTDALEAAHNFTAIACDTPVRNKRDYYIAISTSLGISHGWWEF